MHSGFEDAMAGDGIVGIARHIDELRFRPVTAEIIAGSGYDDG
jgi:hypothetical protein